MADTGLVVLITGGGSGMGREAARRFAAQGAAVALFDVNVAGMAETAGVLRQHPQLDGGPDGFRRGMRRGARGRGETRAHRSPV